MSQILHDASALQIAALLFAAMFAAHEICWRFARRGAARGEADGDSLGPLDAAVSLLMGLILAFSFSMASSRASDRAELTVAEANAIGTAWLRCALLEGETRGHCDEKLRHYLDLRIAMREAGYDPQRIAALLADSDRVLNELWGRLVEEVGTAQRDALGGLVLAAMNDVIDRSAERVVAANRHVPAPVILLELGLCVVWAGFTGYTLGVKNRRHRIGWSVFALLITVVVFVTFDFDRQQRGFIRGDAAAQALYDLRAAMSPR